MSRGSTHRAAAARVEQEQQLARAVRDVEGEEGVARLQVRLRGEARHGGDALLHEGLEGSLVQPAGALRVERLQP